MSNSHPLYQLSYCGSAKAKETSCTQGVKQDRHLSASFDTAASCNRVSPQAVTVVVPFPSATQTQANRPALELVCGDALEAFLGELPVVDLPQADAFAAALSTDGPDFDETLALLPLLGAGLGTAELCASLEHSLLSHLLDSARAFSARHAIAAAYAAHFGRPAHNAALLQRLASDVEAERQIAATALGWPENAAARRPLERLCAQDASGPVRRCAIEALGAGHHTQSAPLLAKRAQLDADSAAREAALSALALLDASAAQAAALAALADASDAVRLAALAVLRLCGAPSRRAVRAQLARSCPRLRAAALGVLEQHGDWRDVEAALPLRVDPDPRVRHLAHDTVNTLRQRLRPRAI